MAWAALFSFEWIQTLVEMLDRLWFFELVEMLDPLLASLWVVM